MKNNLIPESIGSYKFENSFISIFIEQKEEEEPPFNVKIHTFSTEHFIDLEKYLEINISNIKTFYPLLLFKIHVFFDNLIDPSILENDIFSALNKLDKEIELILK